MGIPLSTAFDIILTHVGGETRHHTPALNTLYLKEKSVIHFSTAIKVQFRVLCKQIYMRKRAKAMLIDK